MANLADDDLLLVQRTSAGISTNYSITGFALKEDLTGVTGLIANPVEVLTPLDGSGLSGDINYYPETSAVTTVEAVSLGGSVAVETNNWISIAYGNGRFVAVASAGSGNRAMYSDDGINWTSSTVSSSNWLSVTYGGDKFVAVATNSIMYSTDGISWSDAAAVSGNWYSVTYGNGKFVAVAEYSSATGQQVMYSSNGISWTTASGIPTNQWCSVTYGNGKFVAVANTQSNRVLYSTDGINWTATASADDSYRWWSITYGNGKFVAVERDSYGKVMHSTDGINWTLASAAEPNSWRSVTYGNDKFVAVSASGSNHVMYSYDGINWTSTGQSQSDGWQGVTYGGDKFVAVAGAGDERVMYSYDGISWEGEFTRLNLTNDKVFDSSNGTEMSTVDQVLTAGTVVEGESDSTVLTPAFSTTLYQGNDGTQDINTGIDNRRESLVWIKSRNDVGGGGNYHFLVDTVRGGSKFLMSNITQGSTGANPPVITTFNDNGYSLSTGSGIQNQGSSNYVSWNFRAAPGFFDIVTFSGSGTLNQNRRISHSLGSAPGMIIVKELSFVSPEKDWYVYHSSNGVDSYQALNNGTKATSGFNAWGASPTSTDFGINEDNLSTSSGDYIAYLFADIPGLIKCGSYTGAGVGTSVDVGFRPSWVLIKSSNYNDTNWVIADSSRSGEVLWANTADAAYPHSVSFTNTGFTLDSNSSYYNTSGYTYTYVAIAENATAGDFAPTGTLTADANPSDPSITLTDVMGNWSSGTTAVGQTQLTKYAPGPDDITFTSQNAGTTPFNGTDATLAFRRWTLESRASAGDPWTVVDTYEDYDIVASQDGATPWSSNKPTLASNTMYRVKVAYISTNADPVESVYNTFTTGSN